jgi:hypothetical protein
MSFLRRWLSWSIDWTVQKTLAKSKGVWLNTVESKGALAARRGLRWGTRGRERPSPARAHVWGSVLCACAALHGF